MTIELYAKPIRIRATKHVLEEASGFEYGSWEDHGKPDDVLGDAHPKEIFERRQSVVLIASPAEAERVIDSLLNSADIAHDQATCAGWPEGGHRRQLAIAFETVVEKLRAIIAARPETRR
jgi:hypothetical protein